MHHSQLAHDLPVDGAAQAELGYHGAVNDEVLKGKLLATDIDQEAQKISPAQDWYADLLSGQGKCTGVLGPSGCVHRGPGLC